MGNSFLKVKYFFVICEFRSGREDRSPVGDVERDWENRETGGKTLGDKEKFMESYNLLKLK